MPEVSKEILDYLLVLISYSALFARHGFDFSEHLQCECWWGCSVEFGDFVKNFDSFSFFTLSKKIFW